MILGKMRIRAKGYFSAFKSQLPSSHKMKDLLCIGHQQNPEEINALKGNVLPF